MATSANPISTTPSISFTTFKLLHQNLSFKLFSGEDSSYSALTLEACEDAMINSNITLDDNKIAFVRSNLTCDSLGFEMMQTNSFTPKLIKYCYSTFGANVLKAP